MALTPAVLDPVKPHLLHLRLAELWLIRCQTSLKPLISGADFRNFERVTYSYDQKTERSIWAMEVRPVEAIVISSSLRRMSRTRLTPGAPPAANP